MIESEGLLQIGQVFKKKRLALRYSQQQVADLAGISRIGYQQIEAGHSGGRTCSLLKIAYALHLELMFVPVQWVPAVQALFAPDDIIGDPTEFWLNHADI